MPDVPNAPGVPALASFGATSAALLIADLVPSFFGVTGPQWGIFLNGEAVIAADNTLKFGLRQDLPVSDYQVEEGGFQSYDKVQLPIDLHVTVSAGGSIANRQAFLASIDAVMNTTDLYDVVTPEMVYTSYNFTHRDLDRTSDKGNGLITVNLWLIEIRETSTATISNTQQPAEAGQQNSGNVQPQPTTSYIDQNFSNGNWSVQ